MTPKCLAAFANLKRICEEHLQGQYHIEIIDLLENPKLAQGDQILAIPTLVRKLPEPVNKIIGDLSDTERVLVGLDLRARAGLGGKWPARTARRLKGNLLMDDPKNTDIKEVEKAIRGAGDAPICSAPLCGRPHPQVPARHRQPQGHLRGTPAGPLRSGSGGYLTSNPSLAKAEQIIAAPTLVKELPPPLRKFIGDMSQTEKILVGLEIRPEKPAKN